MSCKRPLKGFIIGIKENGKREIKLTQINVDHLERKGDSYVPIVSEKWQFAKSPKDVFSEYVVIPCGQCIDCRMQYSRQWANRMMLELQDHDEASFVTLTYNDENVPLSTYVDYNGEEQISMTLQKKDLQLFLKRLRKEVYKNTGKRIRYYACGEYGDKTKRPHYHLIIFGVDFNTDKKQIGKSELGFPQYTSETLEKVWTKGYSMVCDVSWQTCAYVARYVTKKHKGQSASYYDYFNIQPEFPLMSRKPGIGRKYFDMHKDEIYKNQEIFISTGKGGIKIRPPRYYDKLLEIEKPLEMAKLKEARKKMSDNISFVKLSQTSKPTMEMLEAEEAAQEERLRSLRRDKV